MRAPVSMPFSRAAASLCGSCGLDRWSKQCNANFGLGTRPLNEFAIVALCSSIVAFSIAVRVARAARTCACWLAAFTLASSLCQPLNAQVNAQVADVTSSDSNTSGPFAAPLEASVGVSSAGSPSVVIELQGAILKTIDATTMAAQVAGPIKELLVKEGDIVTAGQTMGCIHDEALRLELEQLRTQVAMAEKKQSNDINQRLAEKSSQVASTEYQRALSANARVADTYPINEIDRLKLIADRAELEVERAAYEQELAVFDVTLAKGSYRLAYERYTRHQLIAPAGGVVVSVEKRVGEWVEPGTDLLRIVRIDQLRVEGFIRSDQAHPNLVGQAARVALEEQGKSQWLPGKVVFVSPDANPVNSQVRVFIEVDNPQATLRPGLRVRASIDALE